MSEEPETVEDNAAGILNGVMIFLLGALVPGVVVWQIAAHWGTWLSDLRAETALATAQSVALLGVSFVLMRTGLGLVRKNITALRRRRSVPGS